MKTSGVDDPPEISVASVARFVSVLVGAEVSLTWIFGYCFSKALIRTVRVSVAPLPAIRLADQTMVPEVADPVVLADVPPLLPPQADSTNALPAAKAIRPAGRRYLRVVPLDMFLPV